MTREEKIKEQSTKYMWNQRKSHFEGYDIEDAFKAGAQWADQHPKNNIAEQLTAFAVHLNKRGAFRDDICMDFEHEAQSFIEMQNNKEL